MRISEGLGAVAQGVAVPEQLLVVLGHELEEGLHLLAVDAAQARREAVVLDVERAESQGGPPVPVPGQAAFPPVRSSASPRCRDRRNPAMT